MQIPCLITWAGIFYWCKFRYNIYLYLLVIPLLIYKRICRVFIVPNFLSYHYNNLAPYMKDDMTLLIIKYL
jgi:hypothetical protein